MEVDEMQSNEAFLNILNPTSSLWLLSELELKSKMKNWENFPPEGDLFIFKTLMVSTFWVLQKLNRFKPIFFICLEMI